MFETIFMVGMLTVAIIRTKFLLKYQSRKSIQVVKDHPMVMIGIILWKVNLILVVINFLTPWLETADYKTTTLLCLIGSGIFIFSLWLLWRTHNELQHNFSPWLKIGKNNTLITNGIYKKIRHPMYLSFLLLATGQLLMVTNWIAGTLGLISFFFIYFFRVNKEEKLLTDYFDSEYNNYKLKTGRLFPKVLEKKFKIYTLLSFLLLSSCTTIPSETEKQTSYNLTNNNLENDRNVYAYWGGIIEKVKKEANHTLVLVKQYPIDKSKRPVLGMANDDKYFVLITLLEPEKFIPNSKITIRGLPTKHGIRSSRVTKMDEKNKTRLPLLVSDDFLKKYYDPWVSYSEIQYRKLYLDGEVNRLKLQKEIAQGAWQTSMQILFFPLLMFSAL